MTKIKTCPFSQEEIAEAVNNNPTSIPKAAKELSALGRGRVTPQLIRQWITRLDSTELADGFDRSKELVRSRNLAVENNKLRGDIRALADALGDKQGFVDAVQQLVENMPARPPITLQNDAFIGTSITVEALLSDLQIGKLDQRYNSAVARKRLYEYGRALLFQIDQKRKGGYAIERIVLGILGDIIESDKKHKNSGRATDTGTAEQIFDAIDAIFTFVIEPLARLGIPMDVVCITGNHDWDDHGINMFQPGKTHLSWPLYKSLELVSNKAGYSHVSWDIPEGSYAVVDFYGQKAVYEHGVGVANTEASMKAHKIKRAEQEREHITYFRMGDKHTVTTFNAGQMVVNGAFFGAVAGGQEYSGIAGYSSVPAQWMGFHVRRNDARLSLYDQFVIQLDHIGE